MKHIFTLLLPILFASTLIAGEFYWTVEKDKVHLGETIVVTTPVNLEKEPTVTFTKKSNSFFIRNKTLSEGKLSIEIVPLSTGSIEVPEMTIRSGKNDFRTGPIKVTVLANTKEGDQSIKEIKPLKKAFETDYLPLILPAVLLLLFLGFLLLRWLKKRNGDEVITAPSLSPYELAMKTVTECEKLLQNCDFETFVDRTTGGLRLYLEGKSGKPYLEMTTSEVRRSLRRSSFSGEDSERTLHMLQIGDRFKFADENLSTEEFRKMLTLFEETVRSIESVEKDHEISKS